MQAAEEELQEEEDDDEDDDGGDEQYTVQSILDSRMGRLTKKLEYLVSWQGFDESHNSWEPEANLSGAKDEHAVIPGGV